MVEPTYDPQPFFADPEQRRRKEVAQQDYKYLCALASKEQHVAQDLLVMSLRVCEFIRGPFGSRPIDLSCIVCRGVPQAYWRENMIMYYEAVSMHCDAHAEVLHAFCSFHAICCAPEYDPDKEFAWRTEGRQQLELQELLRQQAQAQAQVQATPSTSEGSDFDKEG